MGSVVCLCLIFSILGSCYAASFTFCKINDPDADTCLANSIQAALKALNADIPEYGLKSIDPYSVDKVTLDAGGGPVQLVQYYTNVDLLGFSDVTAVKAHFDDKKKTLMVEGTFPKVTQIGDYIVDGKILALPVTGEGKSSLILENAKVVVNLNFEETQKDGQTYLKIKESPFSFSMVPARMRLHFENLFNGNKLLGDNINKLVNEEWEALYKDVNPSVNKNYGELFRNYAQLFFANVPADKIFLK